MSGGPYGPKGEPPLVIIMVFICKPFGTFPLEKNFHHRRLWRLRLISGMRIGLFISNVQYLHNKWGPHEKVIGITGVTVWLKSLGWVITKVGPVTKLERDIILYKSPPRPLTIIITVCLHRAFRGGSLLKYTRKAKKMRQTGTVTNKNTLTKKYSRKTLLQKIHSQKTLTKNTLSNINLQKLPWLQIWSPVGATCISSKFGLQIAPLVLVTPDMVTCISSKFSHQMAPLPLIPNLVTRWCHLN